MWLMLIVNWLCVYILYYYTVGRGQLIKAGLPTPGDIANILSRLFFFIYSAGYKAINKTLASNAETHHLITHRSSVVLNQTWCQCQSLSILSLNNITSHKYTIYGWTFSFQIWDLGGITQKVRPISGIPITLASCPWDQSSETDFYHLKKKKKKKEEEMVRTTWKGVKRKKPRAVPRYKARGRYFTRHSNGELPPQLRYTMWNIVYLPYTYRY